jgi:predicted membrane-bound spermidine synthase
MIGKLYGLVIFITGFCSLGYQVIWQKYLTILIGSEARSSTIIVAVFLLGLSLGYYLFGLLCRRFKNRRLLLKCYGLIELITGAYVLLFPRLFHLFFESEISTSNNILSHILISFALLIVPTVLMGATMPVMTSVLPKDDENVDRFHSQIYGINTLGAFLGAILTGLVILPQFGHEFSITLLGTINVLISSIYILNRLEGRTSSTHITEQEKTVYANEQVMYALVFFVGAMTICFEMFWIRIVALSIGSGFVVFPFVLSIFILAIGFGSLSLKEVSLERFHHSLKWSLLTNLFAFATIPYLPLMVSHIRVTLITHPATYYLFYFLVYLLLLFIIGPGVFFSGRMLPFVFGLISKNRDNFGFKCGLLYFLNTVGTFLGATLFGYLLLDYFDIPLLYRFFLIGLLLFTVYFFTKKSKLREAGVLALTTAVIVLLPFYRTFLGVGIFRVNQPKGFHYRSPLSPLKRPPFKILSLEDGPNSTVAVASFDKKIENGLIQSKSIFVNGKSDSSTIGDLSTTSLLSLLPYSIMSEDNIDSLVIGAGTGVSAGVLTLLERVRSVDVIEISSALIDTMELFKEENFEVYRSPKTQFYEMDAFQFLKRDDQKKYELIVSEPSNPWVWGVESLFTSYFYLLAKNYMEPEGVFVQWYHTYSSSNDAFLIILKNLMTVFENLQLYRVGGGDIAFVASNRQHMMPRFELISEQKTRAILEKIGITNQRRLNFLKNFNHQQLQAIEALNRVGTHELFYPRLAYDGLRSFFLNESVTLPTILEPRLRRGLAQGIEKDNIVLPPFQIEFCSLEKRAYGHFACRIDVLHLEKAVKRWESASFSEKLKGYRTLRDLGLMATKEKFLFSALQYSQKISGQKNQTKKKLESKEVLLEMVLDGLYSKVINYAANKDNNIDKMTQDFLFKKINFYKNLEQRVRSMFSLNTHRL